MDNEPETSTVYRYRYRRRRRLLPARAKTNTLSNVPNNSPYNIILYIPAAAACVRACM